MARPNRNKALIVLTSHDRIGETGRRTGFFFDEMASPYWALIDAGHQVDIASIAGGQAPADPTGLTEDQSQLPAVSRFLGDAAAMEKIRRTTPIGDIPPEDYAAIFLAGGHGTMWDFAQSEALGRLVGAAYDGGAVIGAVCHGPAGLLGARRADGKPLVEGLRVNGFTNAEEEAVGLARMVPFSLEDRLREQGGIYESGPNFRPYTVTDGRLVTGQNPQSAPEVGKALVEAIVRAR